jgi:hypothetical protein
MVSAPEFVVVGPATRDLLPAGGWQLGGTVTFAALTASRLGLRAGIVTAAPPDVLAALAAAVPGVALAAIPSVDATTFENRYNATGQREQYLRGRATPLDVAAIPPAWRAAPLVLLAPLAQDVDGSVAAAFPDACLAATPQGWLRQWDDSGRVRAGTWEGADQVLLHLTALILSWEDLVAPAAAASARARQRAERQLAEWARHVPQLVVTQGAGGADLLTTGGERERFPAYTVRPVDPTGAGDVFAAAYLCQLHRTGDPRRAMEYANCAASFAIEREGTAGIPTPAEIARRLRSVT